MSCNQNLSAPAADAVMTKPPAAEPGKKSVKSDKDELAKEVEKRQRADSGK